ncbi:MAG: hypothetical protein GEU90_04170 [Gemmatimonas sp.]|nr:hypothetical protein [Gemmatimonas sp.]
MKKALQDDRVEPYLVSIMTSGFTPEALPLYLCPISTARIRENLARLSRHHVGVDSVQGEFDGFNLSDIIEYMAPAKHARIYGKLLERARPEARGIGLGGVLVEDVNRAAGGHGASVLHALMHASNASKRISGRTGSELFRRYRLYEWCES